MSGPDRDRLEAYHRNLENITLEQIPPDLRPEPGSVSPPFGTVDATNTTGEPGDGDDR